MRLLVPTPIDRLHLAARLVAGGASHLGVRIQSLPGFCLELLAGERPVRVLPRILIRRLARRRASLAALVEEFEGGDEVVVAAVERLLAAGFEEDLLAPAREALGPPGSAASERTVDLLELSLATKAILTSGELVGGWQVPARAVERLARRRPPEEVWGVGLPLRSAFDAVITSLLAGGSRWWCESPRVPDRLASAAIRISRLAQLGAPASVLPSAVVATPTLCSAVSFDEALGVVAAMCEEALEGGCASEACAVAYHDPEQGRRALEALIAAGVPAVAPLLRSSPDGVYRLQLALGQLVDKGPATLLMQWFAMAGTVDRELLAVWRSLGMRTIGEVAAVDLDALLGGLGAVVVPAVGGDDADSTAPGGMIGRERLERSVGEARAVLAAWRAVRLASGRRPGLAALVRLGSALGPPAAALCGQVIRTLEGEIPAELVLEPGELATIAASELAGQPPASADGGGVRILPVAVAAESSWSVAIVLDLSARALEPARSADPLFPESTLRRLEAVLPGLVEDRDLEPEEPLLRLTRASDRAIWVYSRRDHSGAPAIASTLWSWAQGRGGEVVEARPRPAAWSALAASADRAAGSDVARYRAAVAHGLDHVVGPPGAQLGMVAPRRKHWWATRLEAAAQCPWRFFLERRLGLVPLLDEPGLGALDNRLVGSLVHTALERLARDAIRRPSKRLELPTDLEGWLSGLAGPATSALGVPLLAAAVAVRAAELLRAAWRLPQLTEGRVVAAEPVGQVDVEGVSVRFRADLALEGRAGLQWVDFKVGTVPDLGSAAWLEREVASGRRLQAALYARGPGVVSSAYVFLGEPERQELDPLRWLAIDGNDPVIESALATAVRVTAAAAELGVAIPRLVDPDLEREGPWCRHCRVVEACSRGDSGVRRRFVQWLEDGAEGDEAATVARKVVRLGSSS